MVVGCWPTTEQVTNVTLYKCDSVATITRLADGPRPVSLRQLNAKYNSLHNVIELITVCLHERARPGICLGAQLASVGAPAQLISRARSGPGEHAK